MGEPAPPVEQRECRYVILFSASHSSKGTDKASYQSVVRYDAEQIEGATFPLGLDRDFIPALPAFWYCLHLPRSRYDFLLKPLHNLKVTHRLNLPQEIIPIPVPLPKQLYPKLTDTRPTIVLIQDNALDDAPTLIKALGNVISVTQISALNDQTLVNHWQLLRAAFGITAQTLPTPSHLFINFELRPTWLPAYFVARELGIDLGLALPGQTPSLGELFSLAVEHQALLSTYFRLKHFEGRTPTHTAIPQEDLAFDREHFDCPIALGVPGVSRHSATRQIAQALGQKEKDRQAENYTAEHSMLGYLVAHRALARNGMGLLAKEISDDAFTLLGQLESHWASGNPKPHYVWRILYRLGEHLSNCLTSKQLLALSHAKDVTCFSEFPIGLAILPGRKSPLTCGFPITYRPIVPLTLTTQVESTMLPTIYLQKRLQILVTECLTSDDPVGKLSRVGWASAARTFDDVPGVEIQLKEVSSLKEFKQILANNPCDILVISAHGVTNPTRDRTGLACGSEIIFGDELSNLPPIICLSACQVAPRGRGTVNVSDLFFRSGAVVVIGTLVPIDVRHNAILMARFFSNIAATINGTEKRFRTLQDIWHFVVTFNAFNDVLSSSEPLRTWATETKDGLTVVQEFMTNSNKGELRAGHIYEDTVARLEEIAHGRGIKQKFQSWIDSQGYVPESVFYVMMGWPERFVFNDQLIAQLLSDGS